MTQSPTSESLKLAGDARAYSYKMAPKEYIIKRVSGEKRIELASRGLLF